MAIKSDGYSHSSIGGKGRDFSDPVGRHGHWTARPCSGGRPKRCSLRQTARPKVLFFLSSRRPAPWTVFHGHRQRRPCFAKRAQELPAFNAQRRQPSRRDAQPWTHRCANSFNCRLSQHLAGLKITQSLVSSVSLVRCEEVAEPARHERCAVSGRVADEIAVASIESPS